MNTPSRGYARRRAITIICVSAQGQDLDAAVDPRFGRCRCCLFVDPETLELEAIHNPNTNATGGAGVRSGQLVADHEARLVLTGNVGPNAHQTLQAAGIKIVTGVSGTVRQAVARYNEGELKPTEVASVGPHAGMPLGGGEGGG